MSCEKNRYVGCDIWRYEAIFSRVALADATARPVEAVALDRRIQNAQVALADATAWPEMATQRAC